MTEKRCSRCGESKPLEDFSPANLSKDGHQAYCKPCAAAHYREWRVLRRTGEKRCGRCGEVKALDAFYTRNNPAKGRYQAWCKDCQKHAVISGYRDNPEKHAAYNREWGQRNPDKKADIALKTRLGLPHGTYARLLAAAEGKCEICGTTEAGPRISRFHVDHDNISGQTRGLLCGRCNVGIGQMLHSVEILERAIHYINKYNGSPELTSAAGTTFNARTE
jgi:hypothetical protein